MTVLAVGAHPDDVELALGGAVARFVAEGVHVVTWIASVPDQVDRRCAEADAAAATLGMDVLTWGDGLGKQVDEVPLHRTIAALEAVIADVGPDKVFMPTETDRHQDHRLVGQATTAALRRRGATDVYMYGPHFVSLLGPQAFCPSLLIDVTTCWSTKLEAIAAHQSQFDREAAAGWREEVSLLARVRGAQAGVEMAEGFQVVRQVW